MKTIKTTDRRLNPPPSPLQRLKSSFIKTLRAKGDSFCIRKRDSKERYTANQLADEIENETDEGIATLEMLLNFSAFLIEKEMDADFK